MPLWVGKVPVLAEQTLTHQMPQGKNMAICYKKADLIETVGKTITQNRARLKQSQKHSVIVPIKSLSHPL